MKKLGDGTSYNTVYAVRYRSPKCSASPRTSHTPIPLSEIPPLANKRKRMIDYEEKYSIDNIL